MRLLVSAKDEAEALLAARAGVDFIDLKDPATGALGGLPLERLRTIVAALRAAPVDALISATIGDLLPASPPGEVLARVAAVAACGVDLVKVGIEPGASGVRLLAALAPRGAHLVPVLLADEGIDAALLDAALGLDAFAALMLDTAHKGRGSLLQRVDVAALGHFVASVRRRGTLAGLAGALRAAELPALHGIGADFAGFRSAACHGDRAGALDAGRVRALVDAVKGGAGASLRRAPRFGPTPR